MVVRKQTLRKIMIPQRVVDHWRFVWGWSEDQITMAEANFIKDSRIKRKLKPIGCNRCKTKPRARKLCSACYQLWRSRGKPNLTEAHKRIDSI